MQHYPPFGDMFHGVTAKTYDAKRANKPIWHAENAAVERYLLRIADGASILDVPFGNGRFADLYKRRGFRVTGIDISHDMLNQARKKLGSYYEQCDLRCLPAFPLPFPDASFDALVSIRFVNAFIAFKDVPTHLNEFRRVCKSYALVSLNNQTEDRPEPTRGPDARMGDSYSLAEVHDLVSACGFAVEASEVVGVGHDKRGEKRVFLLRAV